VARILVIEDNPVNLELVSAILEPEGYEILTARTAEMGLQMAQTERPTSSCNTEAIAGYTPSPLPPGCAIFRRYARSRWILGSAAPFVGSAGKSYPCRLVGVKAKKAGLWLISRGLDRRTSLQLSPRRGCPVRRWYRDAMSQPQTNILDSR